MKNNITKIGIIGLTLIFIGCAVGPDYEPPKVNTPEEYRFEETRPEVTINLKWWELFDDPVLYTIVTKALKNNRSLMIAASRIEEARAYLGFTNADRYPMLDIQAGATTGNFLGNSRSNTTDSNVYIAPTLSWEIDFWGKFRRSTDSAKAQLMATEFAHRTIQLSLISEAVSSYYNLLDYNQRLDVSRKTLDAREESLDIIQKRFDAGIIPELDLNQAQIQREIAAAAIPRYERLILKTENAISILLGGFPEAIKHGKDLNSQKSPDIPVDLPSNILERRPDIIQAKYTFEAQTELIGVAEALRFPSISLTGVLGLASTDLGNMTSSGGAWSLGASLLGPIYNFGKNLRRVEIEEERTRQALYQYEDTVLNAFREVEDALVEIDTYRRQLFSIQNQLKAAQNANELSKKRYDQGVTSYLEVLDSERQLFSVSLEFSESTQQFLNAHVKLYKALGGGWITKEEMNSSYKTSENDI